MNFHLAANRESHGLPRFPFPLFCALALQAGPFRADTAMAEEPPGAGLIRAAVEKALPSLTAGARGSMERRARCFTCHNQGLPIMALGIAQARGIAIDAEELRKQVAFTAGFLEQNKAGYLEGKGQGGQTDTAGFALWALDNGGWKPDAITAAVAELPSGLAEGTPALAATVAPPPDRAEPVHFHLRRPPGTEGVWHAGTTRTHQRTHEEYVRGSSRPQPRTPRIGCSACARSRRWPHPKTPFARPRRTCSKPSARTAVGPSARRWRATPTRPRLARALHEAGGLATTDCPYQEGLELPALESK